MERRKNPRVDLARYRQVFFLIGLIIALSAALWAFSYTQWHPISQSRTLTWNTDFDDHSLEIFYLSEKKPNASTSASKTQLKTTPIIEHQAIDLIPYPEVISAGNLVNKIPADEAVLEGYSDDEFEYTGEVLNIGVVSEVASFIEGTEKMYAFIQEHLKFPKEALQQGVSGRVVVAFVVEPNGKLSQIEAISCNTPGYGFEKEAIQVIEKMSGKWKPAKQGDRTVRMMFKIPVVFELY